MSGREPAVEVEYPLGADTDRRWTLAQTLTVAAVVCAGATLLVGFPSYGLTDTTTFGRGVRGWGVTWCVVTGLAALLFAVGAVVAHGATRAAASRALDRAAAEPGAARRVPVAAQREMATADPWAPTSTMAYVGVAVGGLATLIAGGIGAARVADGESPARLLPAAAGLVVLALSLVTQRATRGRRTPLFAVAQAWPLPELYRAERERREAAATDARTVAGPDGERRVPVARAAVGVVVLLIAIGLCIARDPYKRRPRIEYSPGVEAVLAAVWAVLVAVAVVLVVVAVVGWARGVRATAATLHALETRARAGDTAARPTSADLQRATRTPGVAALGGRGVVGAGVVLVAAGVTSLLTGPAPVLALAGVLLLAGVAGVTLGVRRLATDPVAGRARREVVRAAWPVDPLADLPDTTPTGRKRRRRSRRARVDLEKP